MRALLLLAVAIFCWIVLLSRLAHACEIEPADWEAIQEEIGNE